ncbi:MAG: DMT family transporter [Hyphomicrobiaceae bacterium]
MRKVDANEDGARPSAAADPVGPDATRSTAPLPLIGAFDRLSQPMRATLLMLLAMTSFSAMAVLIRLAAESIHALEIVFFRNLFALVLLLPVLWSNGIGMLRTQQVGLYSLRAVLNILGMFAGFTALTLIPLAEATALSFTAPLFVTIGAVLVLGEVVRMRRIAALAVGFLGVLVVVGPQIGNVSVGTLLALANAMLLALTALVVKRLTATEPVEAIILWMVLISTPLSFVPALFVWQWPDAVTFFYLVCLAGAGTLGHFCWTKAYSLAEVTQLQPLEFVRLPLTAVAGYLIFIEHPAAAVWLGGAIIFLSTAYITRREAQIARQRAQSGSPPE